jgi:hypothetical protein
VAIYIWLWILVRLHMAEWCMEPEISWRRGLMFPNGGGYANFFMVKRTIYTNIYFIYLKYTIEPAWWHDAFFIKCTNQYITGLTELWKHIKNSYRRLTLTLSVPNLYDVPHLHIFAFIMHVHNSTAMQSTFHCNCCQEPDWLFKIRIVNMQYDM